MATTTPVSLQEYLDAAMRHARYEWLVEDEEYFGSLPHLRGAWATGTTVEATAQELREVAEDWVMVALRRGIPMPEVDGLSLATSV